MIEFTKNDTTKNVEDGSMIIPLLLKDGWKADGYEAILDRDKLLAQAKELDIKVHHKAKNETIQKKIDEALNGTDSE